MIIKAKSPAGFAEEYIVKSIWSGHFAPGSILPAERELSELIGVTRTTLREVLQRLARDGWLTIQHGKPTRVNNFWETSGLNILETLARLDEDGMPELVDQLLSARTNISTIYIRAAIRNDAARVVELLSAAEALEDDERAFAEFDYQLNHDIAMASGNPIYVLVLNGFRGLYSRIGQFYFSSSAARELARDYYKELLVLAKQGNHNDSVNLVRQYGYDSAKVWKSLREDIPANLVD
ncbi:fatty acid metabolism transcriptional regulator FadR [Idiomarina tyrosinivorans]|uniref:Fatty acid metabolism regulator protein n=1 Tax=Idiomarina tyrosinivorans TaxID=1445662 RepID=A0A432ZL60_9GAMM|nr:fatty acid metabolism transcriptional regulator FadR [Idiomarina tyrosinivorans]RUO78737.1 fatty acid metabolism transcriptional regulator FadR [Idiomarina tyrosinivorans]